MKHPRAWAWRWKDGVCGSCAGDTRSFIIQEFHYAHEGLGGRPIRVRIVPETDYRKLVKAAKGGQR